MKDSESRIQPAIRVAAGAVAVRPGGSGPISAVLAALPQTDEERRQLAWMDTTASYPNACIHQLFEGQVEQTPFAPAILSGRKRITYHELNRRANQLAHYLRSRGVTRETIVGVSIERSLDMIVALLGILKAGGGYVPLDPGYPSAHLAFMVEDSRAALILTQSRLAARLPGAAPLVCLDSERAVFEGQAEDNLPCVTKPDDLAYVIYTSGSTGQPKGVVGLHRGAVNRFAWMWHAYPFTDDEVCCQKTSLNFVDSLSEIFVPLLRGIPTVIVPDQAAKDPRRLVETMAAAGVTRLVLVPSLLRDILALGDDLRQRLPKLKMCVSSGEALPIELCRRFHERLADAVLLNLYGSTEVSADVTCYDTRLMSAEATAVPLGRPIDNTRIYVLDDILEPVPVGVPGELYVAGDGLARGYLNHPDLSAERFLPDPFSGLPSGRMYKTGDRARYLPDGNIEFLGRLDHQVKIRGFRVELGEIETALAAHPAIRQAVVVAHQDVAGDTRLVAYVVPIDIPAVLRTFCKERLPHYMVPSRFVRLERMPLTPSGKIDRRALPAPEPVRSDVISGTFVAPRTPVEEQLITIWQEALGVRKVGVKDDFFDLGGHSLLAARLTAQIEKTFGRRLAVSALAEAPTIERLAEMLARPEGSGPWSPLIDLQPRGVRRPFFLVHGIGGEVMSFAGLAQRLAPDQPVYGIRAKGSDGVQEPLRDVETMAACYLEAVRSAAPEGPYLLGGYSSGAVVALEMAQQLRAQGEDVAVLAMIDGDAPESDDRATPWTLRHVAAYLHNLASWVVDDDFFRSKPADQLARLRSKGRLVRAKLVSLASRRHADVDIRDVLGVWRFPDHHRTFLEAHSRALATYTAREYHGPITLIRARTLPLSSWTARDLGWGRLARGGLDVRVIRGAHDNILTEPRVRVLAAQLKACLNAAQTSVASVLCFCEMAV
jgi:amino acid adenylation domain-containing protein